MTFPKPWLLKPWMYKIDIRKQMKETAESEDWDKFASEVRDIIREFIKDVKRNPKQDSDDFEMMKEQLEDIADYFDVHSEDGNIDEIDYNLEALYDYGDIYRIVIKTQGE